MKHVVAKLCQLSLANWKCASVREQYNRCIPGRKGREPATKRGNVFNTFNMQNRYLIPFSSIITLIDPIRSVALAAILARHASNRKRDDKAKTVYHTEGKV